MPAAVAFLSAPGDNRYMTDVTQISDAIERGDPRRGPTNPLGVRRTATLGRGAIAAAGTIVV